MPCNCHLYCDQGSEPSDCSVTLTTFNQQVGWPVGQHGAIDSGCDSVLDRRYYCSTHGKYTGKQPVIIEVAVPTGRVAKRYRMSEGDY